MTKQYPDWVYDEMAKRINEAGKYDSTADQCKYWFSKEYQQYIALAKLIHETQEAPEDPYLPIARKAAADFWREKGCPELAQEIEEGNRDDHPNVQTALRAIHALLEHQEQQA